MDKLTEKFVRGVYFIIAPNQNKVKIGKSVDVKRRYSNLKTGFMDTGVLSVIIRDDDERKLESSIHDLFSRERMNLEWFFLSTRLKKFIVDLTFDDNVLIVNDPKLIVNNINYSDASIYSFLQGARLKTSKIVGIVLLIIFGIYLGYYQQNSTLLNIDNRFGWIFMWIYTVFLTFAAPYLWYLILEFGPLFLLKTYIGLILFAFVIEISGALDLFTISVLFVLRAIILVVFQRFGQIVTMKVNRDFTREKEVADAEDLVKSYKKIFGENYENEIKRYIVTSEKRSNKYNVVFDYGVVVMSVISILLVCVVSYSYHTLSHESILELILLIISFMPGLISSILKLTEHKAHNLFRNPLTVTIPIIIPFFMYSYLICLNGIDIEYERRILYIYYFYFSSVMIIFFTSIILKGKSTKLSSYLKEMGF